LYICKINSQLQITQLVIHSKAGLDFHSKMNPFKCCESPAVALLLMLVMLVMQQPTSLVGATFTLLIFISLRHGLLMDHCCNRFAEGDKSHGMKSTPISEQQPTLVMWCHESISLTMKPPHLRVAKPLLSASTGCSGASSLNKNYKAVELQKEEEKKVKIYRLYYQLYFACALN
jgi:hypothetical protein